MQKNIFVGILAVVVVLGGIWFYTNNSSPKIASYGESGPVENNMPVISTSTEDKPIVETIVEVDANLAPLKEFIVRGNNFSFSTSEMKVRKGDRVRVRFINEDGRHDWKVDEFNAATRVLSGGQEETIEFVADRSGVFEYYCSVGSHRQMGMKGNLIVM